MRPGLSEDLQELDDARKTAVINNELYRLQLDIVALQETRLPDSGSLREKDYTFFWQGKTPEEKREHGVGFAIKNSLLGCIVPPSEGSERILKLQLQTSAGPVSLVSAYAPTLHSLPEAKDKFYDELNATIHGIPHQQHLFILGDFNARIGADHASWPSSLGHHGIGKMNDNGQRLLELCSYNNLCVTNTFFGTKPRHRVSWRHPRSKHWHQLDLILTRRSNLNCVKLTRSYHSADCDTDHSLVCTKVKLYPQKIHHCRKKGTPRINTNALSQTIMVEKFVGALEAALPSQPGKDATETWAQLREAIHSTALSVFGKKKVKTQDWFEAHTEQMLPLLEEKRRALAEYKRLPNEHTHQALKAARSKTQQMARRCANDYWLKLCSRIQLAADVGNIRGVYQGIKEATGPTQKKTAPLKSTTGEVIKDKPSQMKRWVEHFSELYSLENTVTEDALHAVERMPTMDILDVEPSFKELSSAIEALVAGKAPGSDGIPAEIIKCAKHPLLDHLHHLLCLCWREGAVPQDMRDANIITLHKKGDRGDCNNYRGISLLSTVGKLFARVILKRLQTLADRVYPESQCGFRSGRSTVDMVFAVRQLQEKCREQGRPLYLAFIDLTKAFDLVSREGLFQVLERIGCPPTLLSIVRSFHDNMKGTVVHDGSSSESFDIRSGVKQGCVLAPTLFGIFFAVLLKQAFGQSTEGIYLHTRSDGKLFNLSRLKAKTKVRTVTLRDFLFADDAAVSTHDEHSLQELMDCFSRACRAFGLTISVKKTNVMGQDVEGPPHIKIESYELAAVHEFTYLGSVISDTLSLETELNSRIGKASTTLARLTKRVWENSKLTDHTKVQVYRACVLSTLLYACETWTLKAHQERRLHVFHMRCLRRILGISWEDKVPNSSVLARANTPSMYTLLKQRRLRWLGHVCRMEDGRIPKDLLYGELASGKRPRGRPLLRYKDICKRDLKATSIDTTTWETTVTDRDTWRLKTQKGLQRFEEHLLSQWDEKRAHRRANQAERPATSSICELCQKDCHSRIGLISHKKSCSSRNQTR